MNVELSSGGHGSKRGRSGRRRTGLVLFGAFLAVIIVVLAILVMLLVGGPVLVGFGVYIGVLAHRARALAALGPPTEPIPMSHGQASGSARRAFGLKPSYGLSAVCILVGILMFIGGVVLVSNTETQPQTASTASVTRPALPSAQAPSATMPQSRPPSSPVPAPAPTTVVVQTQPTETIAPVEPPAVPTSARSEPVAPKPSDEDERAAYYENCDAARAAGVTPIRRGEPGYRPALDRDNDGLACEKN